MSNPFTPKSPSTVDDDLKARFNQELNQSFRNPGRDYQRVYVLLVYWEESDIVNHPSFQDEANDLERLFRDTFKYEVSQFKIPSQQSQMALEEAVLHLILQGAPNTLLILHYGGHGDSDDKAGEHRKKAVWASATRDGPTLDWFKVQPRFMEAQSDVLLIIDACFSAQAARERPTFANRVELFAACSMGQQTPPPGPRSFTAALIREIRASLSEKGFATISEIHSSLSRASAKLFETSVLFELQPGSGKRITLEPLSAQQETNPNFVTSLAIRVNTSSSLSEGDVFDQILAWLTRFAPRVVTQLSVESICHSSRGMLNFTQFSPSESSADSVSRQFDLDSRAEIGVVCQDLQTLLASGAAMSDIALTSDAHMAESNTKAARDFILNLVAKATNLQRVLERAIVATCTEKSSVSQALSDGSVQILGIGDTLRMRELAFDRTLSENDLVLGPESAEPSNILSSTKDTHEIKSIAGFGLSFLEYKYYDRSDRNTIALEAAKRLVLYLFSVLQEAKSDRFRSLNCQTWIHEPELDRFVLVFKIPGSSSTPAHGTLYEAMKFRTRFRPTMDERFTIARKMAEAVGNWHLAGWVHQGLSSRNIVFWGNDADHLDYANPKLCGFEYSRPSAHPSYPRYVENLLLDVYRHPDRQGAPSVSHNKVHDLYSLGVILLEIGLWQRAAEFFGGRKDVSPEEVRETLLANAKVRLAHYVGVSYRDAVIICLSGEFRVKEDNSAGTGLSKAFHDLVISRLMQGINLD